MTEEEITKALNTPIPAYSNVASRQSVGTNEAELRDQSKLPSEEQQAQTSSKRQNINAQTWEERQGGTTTAPQRKQRKRGREKGQRAIDQIWKRQRNEETIEEAQPQEEIQAMQCRNGNGGGTQTAN